MLTAITAEFKKLFTVRSTYIWTFIMAAITLFLSIYVFGYRQSARAATDALFMYDLVYLAISFFGMAATIIAILLISHEYRYSMIDYTITSSKSRLRILAAKAAVLVSYAFIGGIVTAILCYIGVKIGLSLQDGTLIAQNFPIFEFGSRFAVYLLSYTMVGLIFGILFRSIIVAIVAYFVIPTIEGMATMFVKADVTKYLPFRSFDASAASPVATSMSGGVPSLPHDTAIATSLVYIVALSAIAAVLFVRRDAK